MGLLMLVLVFGSHLCVVYLSSYLGVSFVFKVHWCECAKNTSRKENDLDVILWLSDFAFPFIVFAIALVFFILFFGLPQ